MALERLSASYFVMNENLSADDGPRSHDLTKRQCNQLVIDAIFFPNNALKYQYTFDAKHDMMTEISLMRRLAVRELTV